MPTDLVWSNQARTDLLEIYVMIGLEQAAAAKTEGSSEAEGDEADADGDDAAVADEAA